MHSIIILILIFLFWPGLAPSAFASCSGVLPAINSATINATVCTIAGIDGVDKASNETSTTNTGDLTLTGGASLTINSTGSLTIGRLTLTNGSIAIASGGKMQIGKPLYVPDADADGWASGFGTLYDATSSGRRRLSLMRSLVTADCDDTADYRLDNVCCAVATRYRDQDGDGYGNPNNSIQACTTAGYVNNNTDCNDTGTNAVNVHVAATCYVDTDNDNYGSTTSKSCTNNALCSSVTWASGNNGTAASSGTFAANNTDCNDGSALVWASHSQCHTDLDADTYTIGLTPNSTCLNASGCASATQASASTDGAVPTAYAAGALRDSASAPLDCYDANANAKPGSTVCPTTHRGDGSFDYNCSGTTTACNGPYYTYHACANLSLEEECNQWDENCRTNCVATGYNYTYVSGAVSCGAGGYTAGGTITVNCSSCYAGGNFSASSVGAYGVQACQ